MQYRSQGGPRRPSRRIVAGSQKSADAADSLAWASSGFIWDNVLAHGKTFRNYGEWMLSQAGWSDPKKKDKIMWSDFWGAFNTNAAAVQLRSRAMIRTLHHHSDTNSVGWDLKVPDVMRAAEFIRELKEFETNGGFPDLVILFLPNDHTGGDRSDYPEPGSQVADNDLALGRVVEALSHSRFWPDTCLFAIEDDPQAGWDHISGYRTTCYVASAYSRRKHTISTQFNQISIVRTIELILGLPPMNQLDACATPMFDCFINVADLTPFNSVPNRFPLDKITPEPKKVKDRRARKTRQIDRNRKPAILCRRRTDGLRQVHSRRKTGAGLRDHRGEHGRRRAEAGTDSSRRAEVFSRDRGGEVNLGVVPANAGTHNHWRQ
jgi:hypothetical protein